MLPLSDRIADRLKRGEENAKQASPDGKPTDAEIHDATDHTAVNDNILPVDAKGKTIDPPAEAEDDGTNGPAGWGSDVDPKSKNGKPVTGAAP